MADSPTVVRSGKVNLTLFSFVNRVPLAVWMALLAFAIYFGLAFYRGTPWSISGTPYFNYLADAFLHGKLHLIVLPPSVYDLSHYNGYYFLYWPPFPAVLLMPLVLIFGLHISDVFLTILISSLNVGIVAAVLKAGDEAGLFHLSGGMQVLLSLFFGFGTVQLTLAPNGRVWFYAQDVGFLCVALAYLIALKLKGWKAFLLAGVCMACALATRNQLVFAGIWPAWYLLKQHWSLDRKKLAAYISIGLLFPLLAGLFLIYYNVQRFGNPLEFGITYQNMGEVFVPTFLKYGAFNLYYVPINFYYQYIYYPFLGNIKNFFMGGSLFLLSPLFFAIFPAVWWFRKNVSTWMLVLSILLVSIPILLLMGTGWVQFGPRYTLDFTMPLLLLTAMGLQRWNWKLILVCFIISCTHYFIGYFLLKKLIGV